MINNGANEKENFDKNNVAEVTVVTGDQINNNYGNYGNNAGDQQYPATVATPIGSTPPPAFATVVGQPMGQQQNWALQQPVNGGQTQPFQLQQPVKEQVFVPVSVDMSRGCGSRSFRLAIREINYPPQLENMGIDRNLYKDVIDTLRNSIEDSQSAGVLVSAGVGLIICGMVAMAIGAALQDPFGDVQAGLIVGPILFIIGAILSSCGQKKASLVGFEQANNLQIAVTNVNNTKLANTMANLHLNSSNQQFFMGPMANSSANYYQSNMLPELNLVFTATNAAV